MIPSPEMTQPRQSTHVRLPRGLYERLLAETEIQGISMNGLIVALLAGSVGWTIDPQGSARVADTTGSLTAHQEAPDGQHCTA